MRFLLNGSLLELLTLGHVRKGSDGGGSELGVNGSSSLPQRRAGENRDGLFPIGV